MKISRKLLSIGNFAWFVINKAMVSNSCEVNKRWRCIQVVTDQRE